MSTFVYTGASGWGKSYHVANNVVPNIKKAVIFDPRESFTGDAILTNPSDKTLNEIFHKFKKSEKFRIVIRTDRNTNLQVLFIKTCELAYSLGRMIGSKVEQDLRVQLIVDEATTSGIMSSHYYPMSLQYLICQGRHDNVDSHFIAQNPMAIHSGIRELASRVVTFFLNSGKAPILREKFTPEIADKIPKLSKYWRIEADEDGSISVFDDKNQKRDDFLRNSNEIPKNLSRKKGA